MGIGSKLKSFIGGMNAPQQYEEGTVSLTIYPGLSSCWVTEVADRSEKPVVTRQRYGLDEPGLAQVSARIIQHRSSLRLRLIVHRPEIFYKVVHLKDRSAASEYLKGMFPYLTPPMALNSYPLEGNFGDDKYNLLSAVELTPFRRIVEELGEGVLNLETIVPLPVAAMLAIGQGVLDCTTANLVFPGPYCTSMILGAKDGPYMIRSFMPGWLTVVEKLEEAGLSRTEAVTSILERAELAGNTAYDGILQPFRRQVKSMMDETVTFYREQLNGDPPDNIVLCGLEIPNVLFPGEQSDFDPVALVSQMDENNLPNLLKGTPEPLFKKGSFSYVYDSAVSAFKEFKEPPKQPTPGTRKPMKKRGFDYAKVKIKLLEWGGLIKKLLTSEGNKGRGTKMSLDMKIVVGFAVAVFFYIAHGYIELANQYEMLVKSFADVHTKISSLNKEMEDSAKKPKDFWTAKMMALASEVTPPLWITDFTVGAEEIKSTGKPADAAKPEDKSIGKPSKTWWNSTTTDKAPTAEIHSHRITIEGASMPPSFGHLREITDFFERLKNNKTFMRNIKEITFKGLHLDEGGKGDMVRFTFEAIYSEGEDSGKK